MTFLNVVQRPSTDASTGLGSNTILGGAGSFHAAVADASDTTGIRLTAQASLDSQVVRMGVQAPVLLSTDRVYSVAVKVRVKSVLSGTNQPRMLLALRTESGDVTVAGQLPPPKKTEFYQLVPTDSTGGVWTDVELGEFIAAPGGEPWDQATNLAALFIEIGRGGGEDDFSQNLDIAAVYLTINYQQQGTVTLTAPVSGAETRPTGMWEYDSANFAQQQAFRFGVWTQAATLDPNFELWVTPALYITGSAGTSADTSWWQNGADQQWALPGDLVDGTYVAYVQAISVWPGTGGDFTTDPDSITWTRNGSTASPPADAVIDSAVYSSDDMAVLITAHPGTGGASATTAFTLERSTDGINFLPAAPSLTHAAANGTNPVVFADRFIKTNTPLQYRVVAFGGSPLVGARNPSSVLTVTAVDDRAMLHHPTDDMLDTAIEIKAGKGDSGIKRTKGQMSALYYYTGGPTRTVKPAASWGPKYGWSWDLTLMFLMVENPDLWAALDQLDDASCPLWFQLPSGEASWISMGPGPSGRDVTEEVKHVPGNPTAYSWIRRNAFFTEIEDPAYY